MRHDLNLHVLAAGVISPKFLVPEAYDVQKLQSLRKIEIDDLVLDTTIQIWILKSTKSTPPQVSDRPSYRRHGSQLSVHVRAWLSS